ncbi:RibD family protein [Rhizobium grahamii]|uniref:RibD family protein n=1 Tax=Rhizobium grahamii TaxID=1120045 RepID=UPI001FD13887|nr:dihydrofolate reductase family protein [Rhizobium grahamii]
MIEITTLSELTIDGKLSLGSKASSKDLFEFYGDDLRTWFHAHRASNDAIMVGSGTVVSDDPELTVRHAPGPNPLRVIPSSSARLPLDAKLLNDGLPTLVAVSRMAEYVDMAALAAKPNVEVLSCGERCVDLVALMDILEGRGVRSMIVEGGSRLLHRLHQVGLVNRIIIKHIPVITGSMEAPSYMCPNEPGVNST